MLQQLKLLISCNQKVGGQVAYRGWNARERSSSGGESEPKLSTC